MAVVTPCVDVAQPGWAELRQQLWPHRTADDHRAEMSSFVAQPMRFGQFIEYGRDGEPLGFVEVALRADYVNGARSSPVAFLEGIYVVPHARRSGVGRRLVLAAQRWAVERGCTELASDARLENTVSHAMHAAVGFQETERVVYFKKDLS